MAQGTPGSVATAEAPARPGSKNHHYSYGQLKIGARLTVCFAVFAFLVIGGAAVAVWQFDRVEALARRSYEMDQRSLLVMRVHLDVVTFRETLATLATSQDRREFAKQATFLRVAFLRDAAHAQQSFSLCPLQTRTLPSSPDWKPSAMDYLHKLTTCWNS
jgi:hypothetical protein